MLTRLHFVAMGMGGVGALRGKNTDRIKSTREITKKIRTGLRVVLATMRNTTLAPTQNTILKMTTSLAGSGLTSGGGNSSSAMNLIKKI